MDLNLSEICSMLGERIEEYKSTAKKRKTERGSGTYRSKISKRCGQSKIENTLLLGKLTSTPADSLNYDACKLKTPENFSTIKISPHGSLKRHRIRTQNVQPKRMLFEDSEENECESLTSSFSVTPNVSEVKKPEIKTKQLLDSPLGFPSVTKLTKKETLKRRTNIVKILTYDDVDDEENNITENSTLKGVLDGTNMSVLESRTIQASLIDKESATDVETPKSSKELCRSHSSHTTLLNESKRRSLRIGLNARRLNFNADIHVEETNCTNGNMFRSESSSTALDPSLLVLNVGIFVFSNK